MFLLLAVQAGYLGMNGQLCSSLVYSLI